MTLRQAGLGESDAFVAVTNSDNANQMAVQVAKKVFKVPRTIARLYDPAREPSYEALGIRHITGTRLIADVIYEDLIDEAFDHHVSFSGGDVEIVEFEIAEPGNGMSVGDLEIDDRLGGECGSSRPRNPYSGERLHPDDRRPGRGGCPRRGTPQGAHVPRGRRARRMRAVVIGGGRVGAKLATTLKGMGSQALTSTTSTSRWMASPSIPRSAVRLPIIVRSCVEASAVTPLATSTWPGPNTLDGSTGGEIPGHFDHTHRQQRATSLDHGRHGPGVDRHTALGPLPEGNPQLAGGQLRVLRSDIRSDRITLPRSC